MERGQQVWSCSPGDDVAVEMAKEYARENGLTSKEWAIRKYPFSVAVEKK